ncbi:MAG: YqaJ viral recombinase family protein [Ruminococcus sp.]|nr:YqaJ viral recombinase family protein [Ruminococcus sp.]
MHKCKNHASWLKNRSKYIGGSDVACILGYNPWKTNLQLYREKVGLVEAPDLSGNAAVEYGTKAEEHIRALFALDHPELEVSYVPYNSWHNSKYPFAAASLDGWSREKETDRKGVFESKTAIITSKAQAEKWNNRIPDNYYCQVVYYLGVTEWDFIDLRARLRHEYPGNRYIVERDYHIERSECEEDIPIVMEAAAMFYDRLKKKEEPPLLLSI